MNPFPYSSDNKRYHTLAYHNRQVFGTKVYKAVIDAGFTCPNKDGSCGREGCIFCGGGSGYFTAPSHVPVLTQLENELERIHQKIPQAKAIAYFQANTNTYAPVSRLREIYSPLTELPCLAGISIGTRCDCLPDDVLDLLTELSKQTYLTMELGMQSIHEKTIEFIGRGYSHEVFLEGYRALKNRGIRVCVHIINGLPFENNADMTETARELGRLRPDGVKIQLLHIIKGTGLEKMYRRGEFEAMTRESYISTVVKQLEYLPPETVIERITGDGDKRTLIAPLWSTNKIAVLNGIDKLQRDNDSCQGLLFRENIL